MGGKKDQLLQRTCKHTLTDHTSVVTIITGWKALRGLHILSLWEKINLPKAKAVYAGPTHTHTHTKICSIICITVFLLISNLYFQPKTSQRRGM